MEDLTPRQRDVLAVIQAYYKASGHSPSIRYLMGVLGRTSSATVGAMLKTLAQKGYLKKLDMRGVGHYVPTDKVMT